MKRLVTFLSIAMICMAVAFGAKPKKDAGKKKAATETVTSQGVRQQKKQAEKLVRETDAQIKANNREVNGQLNKLNLLNGQIAQCADSIANLQTLIDSIGSQINVVTDSIEKLDNRLQDLRVAFIASLRDARDARSGTSRLAMIFSSDGFAQAFRRLRAVEQFGRWRDRRVGEIAQVKAQLDERRTTLDSLQNNLRDARSMTASRKASLNSRRNEADKMVNTLRGRDRELRRILKEQQQKARDLDAQLNRIIAEETRRAAEEAAKKKAAEEAARKKREAEEAARKKNSDESSKDKDSKSQPTPNDMAANTPSVTKPTTPPAASKPIGSTFASSRGALPWPVDGKCIVVKEFGRQRHPVYPNIETDNAGIDIETAHNATVRSVYDGSVSAVFCPDGETHVVVVRHGDYVSVYANLGTLSCRKGDAVRRGQALGTVYADPSDASRSIMHFEIRNAANPNNVKKENPRSWLK